MPASGAHAPPTLLSVFATFAVGGPQVRFAALANHLGDGMRHLIVAMDGVTAARERLSPALDVTFPRMAIRHGATFGNVPAFRRALRDWRPDLLLTHNWGSLEWAMANLLPPRVRHIHLEDGFGPEERDRQLKRRVYMRRLLLRRSTVVLPSRTLARIAAETWRLPCARLHYIPNGIDLGRFDVPPATFPGTSPVVGTVAALRREKNLPRLLRAFAIARADAPALLVIVGDGPERAGLERLAAELGVSECVIFTGHVSEPAPLIAGFDLFALSSDTEQMPISLIEAMAARLPVAATDVGDVRRMLSRENSDFIVPRDEAALAVAMRALLAAPDLRAQLGAANRARAEAEFDQRLMFARYAALFAGGPENQART